MTQHMLNVYRQPRALVKALGVTKAAFFGAIARSRPRVSAIAPSSVRHDRARASCCMRSFVFGVEPGIVHAIRCDAAVPGSLRTMREPCWRPSVKRISATARPSVRGDRGHLSSVRRRAARWGGAQERGGCRCAIVSPAGRTRALEYSASDVRSREAPVGPGPGRSHRPRIPAAACPTPAPAARERWLAWRNPRVVRMARPSRGELRLRQRPAAAGSHSCRAAALGRLASAPHIRAWHRGPPRVYASLTVSDDEDPAVILPRSP